jgi:hypothetical protein
MTLHSHFTLKISADLFGSLEIKLSAQPSFEYLSEFGLWPQWSVKSTMVGPALAAERLIKLKPGRSQKLPERE